MFSSYWDYESFYHSSGLLNCRPNDHRWLTFFEPVFHLAVTRLASTCPDFPAALRYIWDYCEPSAVHSLPGDSAIISIDLCPTKSDAFGSAAPEFVLVMATRVSVTLVGLTFNRSTLGPNRSEFARLQMSTQRGYSAPTDGAFFHSIRSTPGGRIFLLSGAPHVYELTYSAREGWFRSKCRLVRHFIGLGWQGRIFLDWSGPILDLVARKMT